MLYDDQGNFIDDLPSTEIRYIISYDEMPQNLINAYISIERRTLYDTWWHRCKKNIRCCS